MLYYLKKIISSFKIFLSITIKELYLKLKNSPRTIVFLKRFQYILKQLNCYKCFLESLIFFSLRTKIANFLSILDKLA